MAELNDRQIAILTARIVRWMLFDTGFLRSVAREQAEKWTLEEYYEEFPEEAEGE